MKLGAYILFHNEEDLLQKCIDCLLPYVDELLLVNHGSTDNSMQIVDKYALSLAFEHIKVRHLEIPYNEPTDMGLVRTTCVNEMQSEWILAVDADEFYTPESMEIIRHFVDNPGEAISARVKYHNLAWRHGFKQSNFNHAPDRLYKKECIEKIEGILPLDMLHVKKEYLDYPFKSKGVVGLLEYDCADDLSIEHRKQPILDAWYFHLARTRGYNYEFNKWTKYHRNIGNVSEQNAQETARTTHWVNGLYDMERIDVPFEYGIKNPKVSVIIPSYNYGKFVGLAIQSVLNQTYPAFEIIVVDDGSQDRSSQEIAKYPVTLVKQSNQGVANARNNGAKLATGDYLIFLDADDEIAPNYIERCLQEMKGDVQVVYSDIQFIGESCGTTQQPEYSPEAMRQWQVVPSTCALIDRHVWELVGGFKADEIYEDWGFWLRVSQAGYNFKHICEPIFRYRTHGKSRIDFLDSQQVEGFRQLKDRYNITREPDYERIIEAKRIMS